MPRRLLVVLLVVAAVALAYASSVSVPFLSLDDPLYITANTRVQAPGLHAFLHLWDPRDAYRAKFLEYFPLRDSVYWALWQLFPNQPLPFHIVNMLVHAAASLLVAALALRLRLSERVALLAAVMFAVHPTHIESVVWIAGLKDPLYFSFMAAALLVYARFLDDKKASSYGLALALMVLSLLCKSMGFVAPLLFFLLDLYLRPDARFAARAQRLLLPSTIAAIFAFHFIAVGKANHVITPPWGGSWLNNSILVLWIFAKYAVHAIVPVDFRIYYCFTYEPPIMLARLAGGVAFLVGFIAAARFAWRRSRVTFFLLLWFPVALLPVSNVVPFPALFADRYLYAASTSVCIALAVLLDRAPRRPRLALTLVVPLTFAAVTAARGALWHDEAGLYRAVLEDDACQSQPLPYIKLGDALVDTDPRTALELYHRGLNMGSGDPRSLCAVHVFAAKASLAIDDVQLAARHADAILATCAPDNAEALAMRATVEVRRGNIDGEVAAAERAAAADPRPGRIWNRGVARLRKGMLDDGARDLAAAVDADSATFCPLYRAILASPGEAFTSDVAASLARLRGAFGARCAQP